ncbi:protein kinase family protein [Striga asiatica]|uniref:RING-type E3 ubiquitin transferase n=1 Tax=Striga asiatica TaxID=4170 RepID=A0A5A7R1P5_STRAF|nr:protein kinase family protein [Striga asiatica]
MWLPNAKGSTLGKKGGRNGLVAVAVDNDKASQHAIKWAIDNLLSKAQIVILIHVLQKPDCHAYSINCGVNGAAGSDKQILDKQTKELFLTYHCFCTRKDILCFDVVLEDVDISKAITDYVAQAAIENLVLGSSRHGFIRRFKTVDVPSSVSKAAPDFCTVYVISKSKISSVRNAYRIAPFTSPLMSQIQQMQQEASTNNPPPNRQPKNRPSMKARQTLKAREISRTGSGRSTPRKSGVDESDLLRSPFMARGYNASMFDMSETDTDISFISSDRPSTDRAMMMEMGPTFLDGLDSARTSRVSISSESSLGSSACHGTKLSDMSSFTAFSTSSLENAARLAAEQEKAKYKAAMENAKVAQRIAEIESRNRVGIEKRTLAESDNKDSVFPLRYRRYSIVEIEEATENFTQSRKIGEGSYGPVYKCYLDHTAVAVKISMGLNFLHQTKPEPLVHRDLKPGNILLDRNFVSKISDVGLARLVPPSVAEEVTQYRMTSAAGTFCYIDPEYQQTGMLGVKSDVYSLGIVLLQILTARPPMGLAHHVGRAVEEGRLAEMLDPSVPDWPAEQALALARLALRCAELRRKDRPDLGKVVVPELNRLREFGEERMGHCFLLPNHSRVSEKKIAFSLERLSAELDEIGWGRRKSYV